MNFSMNELRQSYQHARALAFDEQLRECVDQLYNPELIKSECLATHASVAKMLSGTDPSDADATRSHPEIEERAGFFYASRDIFVVRDTSSFTCLSGRVDSLPWGAGEPDRVFEGLDYLAITCTAEPRPVLGVVQSVEEGSAYPLLLRSLACLCELAHPSQLMRLDRHYFLGLLGDSPKFDLHVVLFDESAEDQEVRERTPISQLTRDLAELLKSTMNASPDFPDILNDILCLQMNPARFDGRVRFDWRV